MEIPDDLFKKAIEELMRKYDTAESMKGRASALFHMMAIAVGKWTVEHSDLA